MNVATQRPLGITQGAWRRVGTEVGNAPSGLQSWELNLPAFDKTELLTSG